MDKNTLSNYGWIVIAVLVLSVMIALATPFGQYVEQGVRATTEGLFNTSKNAVNTAFEDLGVQMDDQTFEEGYKVPNGGNTEELEPLVAGATFDDGTFLTWEELQLDENGTNYGYPAHEITNTTIGSGAFAGCTCLTSITIPDSVTSIGNGAFEGCSSIITITIPDNVTSIGSYAFQYCTSLTSITIPDSITTICDSTFSSCVSLTSITIPDNVTSIDDYAFNYCESLTNINIPDSVTSIGYEAFFNCISLTAITLPDNVTTIGDGAFAYCASLASITIPDSVTNIKDNVFYQCTSLTSITFGGTKTQWNAITLGLYWNYDVPATVIHCTDGDVTL